MVVTVRVAVSMVKVRFAVMFCLGLPESCTPNVSGVLFTDAVGVPVMAPVAALRESPAGSVPLAKDQVYGDIPPLAASVTLYAEPTFPLGREAVVIAKVAGVIVSERILGVLCGGVLLSVTLNVSESLVAGEEGVPLITPVDAFSDNPAGKVPLEIDQV